MDFFNETYLILGMLIVPVVLAIDWAIRNVNWDSFNNNDEGFGFGPEGHGYYYKNGLKCTLFEDDNDIKTVFDDD